MVHLSFRVVAFLFWYARKMTFVLFFFQLGGTIHFTIVIIGARELSQGLWGQTSIIHSIQLHLSWWGSVLALVWVELEFFARRSSQNFSTFFFSCEAIWGSHLRFLWISQIRWEHFGKRCFSGAFECSVNDYGSNLSRLGPPLAISNLRFPICNTNSFSGSTPFARDLSFGCSVSNFVCCWGCEISEALGSGSSASRQPSSDVGVGCASSINKFTSRSSGLINVVASCSLQLFGMSVSLFLCHSPFPRWSIALCWSWPCQILHVRPTNMNHEYLAAQVFFTKCRWP